VLGVSRDADLGQIRQADKQLARQHHPEACGGSSDRFVEIREAYETPRDREARKQYDRETARRVAVRTRDPTHTTRQAPAAQDRLSTKVGEFFGEWVAVQDRLSSEVGEFFGGWVAVQDRLSSEVGEFFGGWFAAQDRMSTEVDEFFGGWVAGFFNSGRMAARQKDLYVELILDRGEAASGGLYRLAVPVHETCPTCAGTGFCHLQTCPQCHGRAITYPEVELSVPPDVADGARVCLSLGDIGLRDVRLNVLVTIS
jgi:DnaJ-class molecular chaperone